MRGAERKTDFVIKELERRIHHSSLRCAQIGATSRQVSVLPLQIQTSLILGSADCTDRSSPASGKSGGNIS